MEKFYINFFAKITLVMAQRKVQKKIEQSKKEESHSEASSGTESESEKTASEEEGSSGSEEESEESISNSGENSTEKAAGAKKEEKEDLNEEEAKEERTIFIKGISYQADEKDLTEMFKGYGEIQEVRIPKARDGRGKGFAYIEFCDKDSCTKSLEISGKECDGRRLVVDYAKSGKRVSDAPLNKDERSNAPRTNDYNRRAGDVTVFLGNIPFEFDKDEFMNYIKSFADVKDLRVPTDRDTGRPKGFAFAALSTQSEAEKLLSAQLVFQDRNIRAQISEQNRDRDSNTFNRRDGNRGGYNNNRRDEGSNFKRNWSSENTSNKKHVKFE